MKNSLACLFLACATAMLQGCGVASIKTISVTLQAPLELNKTASFDVKGVGVCPKMRIDFGDGSPDAEAFNVDLATTTSFTHTYTGWGGGKIVKAEGVTNCAGTAQTHVKITPEEKLIGYMPNTSSACSPVPNLPALRKNTLVHASAARGISPLSEIDFGCPFNGCHYNLMGLNSPAPTDFSFPGMRMYSMVLRVGTQAAQGPTSPFNETRFTTNQAGPLEICVNDNSLGDNTGGWGVIISIDELGP